MFLQVLTTKFHFCSETEKEDVDINFEVVRSLDEYGAGTATTMREGAKAWNTTVQWWLLVNVYKRLPSLSRPLRAAAVMFVSSAWHGINAGFYLSMLSWTLVLPVEDFYEKLIRRRLVNRNSPLTKLYDFIAWFARSLWMSYLTIGLQLVRVDSMLRFWQSIFYIGHLTLPSFYILGVVVIKPLVNILLPEL